MFIKGIVSPSGIRSTGAGWSLLSDHSSTTKPPRLDLDLSYIKSKCNIWYRLWQRCVIFLLKHITPKPQRTFDSSCSRLVDPWISSSENQMETNSNSENIPENSEFLFIRRLRLKREENNRVTHSTDSKKISVQESSNRKRLGPSDSNSGRKSDSDSQPTREEKVPRRESSSSSPSKSPEKKKKNTITWP